MGSNPSLALEWVDCGGYDSIGRVLAVFMSVCEEQLHMVGYVRMKTRHHVAVCIERDCDRAVTEHLLHDFRMNAPLEKLRRCGMTKIVDSDLR